MSRWGVACLVVALVGCQPIMGLSNTGAGAGTVSLGAVAGAALQVRLPLLRRFQAMSTEAHIAKFVFELYRQDHSLAAAVTVADPEANFTQVPNGTYYLKADVRDAQDQSLVVGGMQTSSNTATVSGKTVAYSIGSAFALAMTLIDSPGGNSNVALSAPFNAGIGASLVNASSGQILMSTTAASLSGVSQLEDGLYYLWAFAHNGAGLATPAHPSGAVVVSDKGLVNGTFNVNVPAVINPAISLGNGDGGPASGAFVYAPRYLQEDPWGNLLVMDTFGANLRIMARTSGTFYGQTLAAGNIASLLTGLTNSSAVALDAQGNIFFEELRRLKVLPAVSGTLLGQAVTAGVVTTLGGDGNQNPPNDNGPLSLARFDTITGIAIDGDNNVYVSDNAHARVRMVPRLDGTYFGQAMTGGNIYTIAGDGTPGYQGDGGAATGARLQGPGDLVVDAAGNLIINDSGNHRIRLLAKTTGTYFGRAITANQIDTIAGDGGAVYAGDDVDPRSASLQRILDMDLDAAGNLYLADGDANRIRMVPASGGTYYGRAMTANRIYSIMGDPGCLCFSGDGGPASAAGIFYPTSVVIGQEGHLFWTDESSHRVRGVAANAAMWGQSTGVGNVYTLAGNGESTGDGAPASSLATPAGIVASDPLGNVYVNTLYTLLMAPTRSGTYFGRSMQAGKSYLVAGQGLAGFAGDNGPAGQALLNRIDAISADRLGNVYFVDSMNSRIRMVVNVAGTYFGSARTQGHIYTIAGDGNFASTGDGGPATVASLLGPAGLACDADGNLYVAEYNSNTIRVIANVTGTVLGQAISAGNIDRVAGSGNYGFAGDGGAALGGDLGGPYAVAVDGNGNLIIADSDNNRIRVVPKATGTLFGQAMTANGIYTVAGDGGWNPVGDGGPGTAAQINWPSGVAVDGGGNVYIGESNNRVRMLDRQGTIYTVAGNGVAAENGDGGLATSAAVNGPNTVAIGPDGTLYLTSNNGVRQVN